jgi:vacuolar-type H+-ATPase catalytic subunit A/Vma1
MINLYLKEETALVKTATIYGINGPVIYLKGNTGFCMSEMVYVGKQKLVGEVIALDKDLTTVQVYEETTGLYPGEEVIATGNPVSVTLAPGNTRQVSVLYKYWPRGQPLACWKYWRSE